MSETAKRPIARHPGADLLRVLITVAVVVYHTLLIFLNAYETPPGICDALIWSLSVPQNELLIFLSLFLLYRNAFASGGTTRKLVGLYIFWTLFYLGMGLLSIIHIIFPQGNPLTVVGFILVAGGSAYHLHFFATLIVFHATQRFWRDPPGKVAVFLSIPVAALGRMVIEGAVIASGSEVTAGQLLLLHLVKCLSYVPYAWLAAWSISPHNLVASRAWVGALCLGSALVVLAMLAVDKDEVGTMLMMTLRALLVANLAIGFATIDHTRYWLGGLSHAAKHFAPHAMIVFALHPLLLGLLLTLELLPPKPIGLMILVHSILVLLLSLAVAVIWGKIEIAVSARTLR